MLGLLIIEVKMGIVVARHRVHQCPYSSGSGGASLRSEATLSVPLLYAVEREYSSDWQ